MVRKTFKTIEIPGGKGTLWKKDDHIANVSYRLVVRQEIKMIESIINKDEIPGVLKIYGEIKLHQADLVNSVIFNQLNSDEIFTLHLADNRQLNIFIIRGYPFTGQFVIVPSTNNENFIAKYPL